MPTHMLIDPPATTLASMLTLGAGLDGSGAGRFLVSWYKPFVIMLIMVPWAIIISRVYDKHAARFFLPRKPWNLVHMGAGVLALAALLLVGLGMPGSEGGFWVGVLVALVILGADLYAYAFKANRDDRVPEAYHIKLDALTKMKAAREAKAADKNKAKVRYTIKAADAAGKYSKTLEAPIVDSPEYAVRTTCESMYDAALKSRAAQIEIVPTGKDGMYAVKQLIDGVFVAAGEPMPAQNALALMDFWKKAAGLDVADRRRKLEGMIQVEDEVAKHMMRVTSIGAQGGMRVVLLLDPDKAVTRKPEDLGLLDVQMQELKGMVAECKGVVLVTSPPDGGRTTTLYTLLRMHDAYTQNVQTVEIDPQAAIEGVRANKFDAEAEGQNLPAGSTGPEFWTLVRSILRRDPQVVGIGDLPDQGTAKEITRADLERCRVYVSYRAGDALTAVQAWSKMVGEPKPAGEAVHGVVTGKLVRKLCTNCRVPYAPSGDMLKKLGLPEGKIQQLFKKGGQVMIKNKPEVCPMCQGHGYFGQEGVFEVFALGKEERDLVVQGNYTGLKAAMRKKQMPTLQQVAIRKAVDGITSVEEVMRVTTAERPPEAAAQPAAPGAAQPAAKPPANPTSKPAGKPG